MENFASWASRNKKFGLCFSFQETIFTILAFEWNLLVQFLQHVASFDLVVLIRPMSGLESGFESGFDKYFLDNKFTKCPYDMPFTLRSMKMRIYFLFACMWMT